MNSGPEAAFFCVVAVLTVASLWRELPAQAVVAVMAVTFAIAAAWFWVMKEPCWWAPLITLNSRGASRWLLRRWRDGAHYGWWVMALACALATVLRVHWSTPVLALAMQLAALPWLIKRRPGRDEPAYFGLVNWALMATWLAISKVGGGY